MSSAHADPPAPSDGSAEQAALDRVSHGYAPDGRAASPPPVPLEKIVEDVVDNVGAAVRAELELLEARGQLAWHGVGWASVWGIVAAGALAVAMLALAFGTILILSPEIGPFLATLIVLAVLLVLAGFAAWRAKINFGYIRTAFRSDLINEGVDD